MSVLHMLFVALCVVAAAPAHGRLFQQGRHLAAEHTAPSGPMAKLISDATKQIQSLTGGSSMGSSSTSAESEEAAVGGDQAGGDGDGEGEGEGEGEDGGGGGDCPTIAEVASGVPELSTLVSLVTAEGGDILSAVTNPDTAVTVFAPTNDAFAQTLETLGLTAEDLTGNKELLGTVLKYHVHGAPAQAADLTNDMTLTTLAGVDLTVKLDGDNVMIDGVGSDAKVVQADVEACKSVVHVIDNVLLPVQPSEL